MKKVLIFLSLGRNDGIHNLFISYNNRLLEISMGISFFELEDLVFSCVVWSDMIQTTISNKLWKQDEQNIAFEFQAK